MFNYSKNISIYLSLLIVFILFYFLFILSYTFHCNLIGDKTYKTNL